MEKTVGFISKKEQKEFDKFIWKIHEIIRKKKLNPMFESGGRGLFSLKESDKFIADIVFRFNGDVVIKNVIKRDQLSRERIEKGEEFFKKLKSAYKIYKENKEEGKRYDNLIKELTDSGKINLYGFVGGGNNE